MSVRLMGEATQVSVLHGRGRHPQKAFGRAAKQELSQCRCRRASTFAQSSTFRGEYRRPASGRDRFPMNLHEYQSKALFAEYGIPVPKGQVATTPAEAKNAAAALGGNLWVVKAQVHAGGRGKAGGVKLAKSLDEVEQHAKGMLGKRLVTHQSGPEGLPVDYVYVESGSAIARELYLS